MRPPVVESVTVKNYRALRDLRVKDLQPLTVLVGPNGSGKSTLFDVFAFLSACFTDGVRRACDARGGVHEIRSRGGSGSIVIELSYREKPNERLLTYHLEIDEEQRRPVVTREWLRWTTAPGQGRPRHILDFQFRDGTVWDEETGAQRHQTLSQSDVLAVNALGQFKDHPRVEALRQFISGWHLSYLSVEDERAVPVAGPQERLSRTGDNLSNVLQYLSEQHPERLRMITEALQKSVPAVEHVSYETSPDGRLVLRIKDAPFDEPVLARYASDGTLKMLAYLLVLYDPTPAPFIGIEEPENFLYPTLLPGLADVCREASNRSQVVVTTHSYEFVNACRPKEIVALYRDEWGYSRVVRPHESPLVQSMLDNGAQLGALWQENYFDDLPAPYTRVATVEESKR